MKLGVLGPVVVEPEGSSGLGGARQRRLLAALLLDPGRVVSIDRLAEIVFEGQPTDAAAVTLRSYVARLRKALEETGSTIVTQAPGYLIDPGPASIDARLFESALHDARDWRSDGRMVEALDRVNEGLSLWRGPAYAEFAAEAWVQPEAIRLDELRLDAEELRLECMLDLGRHVEAVSELTALVERHPIRESAQILLLTALYRSGRQAEALRAATAYRRGLGELGLEPTSDFDAIEDRIAVHDPDLRRPPPTGRSLRGYQLEELIDEGPDTVVHTAIQPGVDRLVAIESFGPPIADHPMFIRDFETRVKRVARLDHPGLVEILDYWREPGSAHLVTRLARGGDLMRMLEKGPMSAKAVTDMTAQVAAALETAHANGLWHGHLRPKEIVYDDEGSAFVLGVGTREIIEATRADNPVVDIEPGPARDQAALAVLAYQALTGVVSGTALPPNGGDVRVSDHRPELLALDGVLARAWAAHHEDRYPDIATFAAAFSTAIGVGGAPSLTSRVNPYKGLRPFVESDSSDFYGREDLAATLLDRLAVDRFVTVIGASGSGKSSVVRAGVVAAIRDGRRLPSTVVATMVPGSSPFVELTRALRAVVPLDRSARVDATVTGVHEALDTAVGRGSLLLVIDQLEELYTLVTDGTERDRFIEGLIDAIEDADLDFRVLATLRADFFDRPLQHHRLGELVSEGAVAIPAMSPWEIERAVVEPASGVGVTIDGALTAELVADTVDQPAGLPLLQFALTELFEARRSNEITLDDYVQLGGVAGAIAERAERLHGDASGPEREAISVLFLRLISVGSASADVRRRTDRNELISAAPDPEAMARVIDRFGAARLLTFDHNPVTREPTVEVAHEALLRHWPRLHQWVEGAGRDLEARAHLTATAAAWQASDRDEGELYRGARLAGTEEWVDRSDLTELERQFLSASIDRRTARQEAERAQLEAQVRANRLLRRSLGAVGVVLIVALVAGFVAVGQRNRARDETVRAEQARGRTLGVIAGEQVTEDRSLSLLLAAEAARIDQSDVTRRALLEALSGNGEAFTRTVIPSPARDYLSLVLTPDGSMAVAKRIDGSIDIVDMASRTLTAAGLPGPPSVSAGLDLSDDGRMVIVSGIPLEGSAAIAYDLPGGTEQFRLPLQLEGRFHQAVFVPGSDEIVMGDEAGRLTVWDSTTGGLLRTLDRGREANIISVDVSGRTAYVIDVTAIGEGEPSFLSAWNIDTGTLVAGPATIENDLVGRVLVAGDRVYTAGDTVLGFDATTLELVSDGFGQTEANYQGLAVSPGGLIAAGNGIDLDVWFEIPGQDPVPLPVTGRALGVAFAPDGSIVTADQDGFISTWVPGWVDDLGTPLEPAGPGLVTVSPPGDVLAVWARGRGVQLFDRATLEHQGELEGLGPEHSFLGFDFSPDGTMAAALTCPADQVDANCDASLELFEVSTMRRIAGPVAVGPVWWEVGKGVEFTSDGGRLAVASAAGSGEIHMFEVPSLDPAAGPLRLVDVAPAAGTRTMVLSAGEKEGRSFVAGVGEFGQTAVWDITAGPSPVGYVGYLGTTIWFGPDGNLHVGSGNGIVVVDPLTLDRVAEFDAEEAVFDFAMSETGILVANSVVGGTTLYDTGTGELISGDLPAFGSAISPDGAELYLGAIGEGEGGTTVAALPLDVESLAAEACRRAGRNLTAAEWRRYMPAGSDHRATCDEWGMPQG